MQNTKKKNILKDGLSIRNTSEGLNAPSSAHALPRKVHKMKLPSTSLWMNKIFPPHINLVPVIIDQIT